MSYPPRDSIWHRPTSCFNGLASNRPRVAEPCAVCGCTCIGYLRAEPDRCWKHERGKSEQARLGL